MDSSVFFIVVLQDRLLLRIESEAGRGDPTPALRERLGDLPVEVELTSPNTLLDVELLGRSPSVYKPVVVSDWRAPGRHILNVHEGMIEWPRPTLPELWRWLVRNVRTALRRRRLARRTPVAPGRRP
jgi:hypothetical protein